MKLIKSTGMRAIIVVCATLLSSYSALAKEIPKPTGVETLGKTTNPNMVLKSLPNEIKIMSYNLQNLFDDQHDDKKDDYTWLPATHAGKIEHCNKIKNDRYRRQCLAVDWSSRKITDKIAQIRKTIKIQGSLPDMLAVEEIENKRVAKRLARNLGYSRVIITNSPDRRGIDVALLFNEDKVEYIEHEEINIKKAVGFATRNILRVHFQPLVGNTSKTLGVYVNHWPSQALKASVNPGRLNAALELKKAIQKQTEGIGKENYYVVATGDFNTLTDELPNAFTHGIQSPTWENSMADVHYESYKGAINSMRFNMPKGTYWYSKNGAYNRFDRFFVSKNLIEKTGAHVVLNSYRIVGSPVNSRLHLYRGRNQNHYISAQWVPIRYNFQTEDRAEIGFSDHYPIVVKLAFTGK